MITNSSNEYYFKQEHVECDSRAKLFDIGSLDAGHIQGLIIICFTFLNSFAIMCGVISSNHVIMNPAILYFIQYQLLKVGIVVCILF